MGPCVLGRELRACLPPEASGGVSRVRCGEPRKTAGAGTPCGGRHAARPRHTFKLSRRAGRHRLFQGRSEWLGDIHFRNSVIPDCTIK